MEALVILLPPILQSMESFFFKSKPLQAQLILKAQMLLQNKTRPIPAVPNTLKVSYAQRITGRR